MMKFIAKGEIVAVRFRIVIIIAAFFLTVIGFGQNSSKKSSDFKKEIGVSSTIAQDSLVFLDSKFDQISSYCSPYQQYIGHYSLGNEYHNHKDYANGLYHADLAVYSAEILRNDTLIADAYLLKGSIEFNVSLFDESLSSFQKANKKYKAIEDSAFICVSLIGIGSSSLRMNNVNLGYQAYSKALIICRSKNDVRLLRFVSSNMAAYFLVVDLPDSTIKYAAYSKSIQNNLPRNDNQSEDDIVMDYGNLAYAYTLKNEFNTAHAYFDSSFAMAYKLNMDATLMNLHLDRSELYKKQQNWLKANEDLNQYLAYKNSIERRVNTVEVMDWQKAIEINHKQRALMTEKHKVSLLNHQTEIQSMQNRLLLFVSLFTLSAIGLLFWRFRSKQLKRKELLEKNLELERLNAELGAAQLENQKLLNQELNEELNYKKGDLTNLSIDISRRNDFTLKVIELIKKLDIGASNEGQMQKRELIIFLSHQKSIDTNLKDIQTNMDIVNQEFVSKLSDKHPELTKTDIQICSLYRIGLNSKDISALKGISPKSVEMSRYRLRKKLALTPEMDLIKFLQEY